MLLVALVSTGCSTAIQTPAADEVSAQAQCLPPSTFTAETEAYSAQDALAVAQNIVNCMNASQYSDAVSQTTPAFIQAEFGLSDPEAAQYAFTDFPPFVVESIGNAQQLEPGRFSVELRYRREVGAHMLVHERWIFTEVDGRLLLSDLEPLPVTLEGDYTEVDVHMTDFAFELSQTSFAPGSTVVFHAANVGDYPHEFVVFRLPEGTDMEAVRQGELPDGLQFIGVTSASAGEVATDLVLVDLDAGHYAVICFIGEPEGIPHLARGMVREFRVE